MASSGRVKEPKLAQLDRMLYKRFTAMYPEEKPVIWLVIIETAESFYVEMKTVDKCTFRAVTNNYLQELRSLLVLSDN
jgi:hypothetical protein